MFQSLLRIFIWILGITILFFSFFFGEEYGFSTSQEIKNESQKNTRFTKLTNLFRNIYGVLVILFMVSVYFLLTTN